MENDLIWYTPAAVNHTVHGRAMQLQNLKFQLEREPVLISI